MKKKSTNRRLAGIIFFTTLLVLLGVSGIVFGQGLFKIYLPTVTNTYAYVPPTPTSSPIPSPSPSPAAFNGQQALNDVIHQVDTIGNRAVGTPGHDQIVQWITGQLQAAGWDVMIDSETSMGHPIQNIIAYRSAYEDATPWIIVGAHYDNRMYADQDPDPANRTHWMPGANDGASGVAVLLELARTLPKNLNERTWLVFWDAEDNGNITGWDWILGSKAFVANYLPHYSTKPDAMVNIDMIGDAGLNIPQEQSSVQFSANLVYDIWNVASNLGYSQYFKPVTGQNILDDHTPFISAGIPAIDIIDFTYPDGPNPPVNSYWHTTMDTPDKVSAQSMTIVGDVLTQWLKNKQP